MPINAEASLPARLERDLIAPHAEDRKQDLKMKEPRLRRCTDDVAGEFLDFCARCGPQAHEPGSAANEDIVGPASGF